MSVDTANAHAIARATRSILKGTAARMGGKTRGANRAVRRHSYDHEDPRARPWSKIGDGSVAQGLAHREAVLQVADELYHQEWKALPRQAVREARTQHAVLSAELVALDCDPSPAPGRRATIRQELVRLEAILERARGRLRLVDLKVLKAIMKKVDFATGRLFPSIDTIAAEAGCHRNSVDGAKSRLKLHGLLDWVRRSIRTGNDGEFAPQREQTSNAYFFDHRRRMAPRVWQRFWQILVAKLRRLGAVPAAVGTATAEPQDPSLRAALAGLSAAVGVVQTDSAST